MAGPDDRVYPAAKMAVVAQALAIEPHFKSSPIAHRVARTLAHVPAMTSLREVLELYKYAALHVRDPLFALRTGLRFHVSSYGMYGFAILSSTNFRKTERFIERFHQLATPLADISFSERSQFATWAVVPMADPVVDPRLYRFLVELQLASLVAVHRDVMGRGFAPSELHVTYAAVGEARPYAEVCDCAVLFEQRTNCLRFRSSWLDKRPECGNEVTFAELLKLCDDQLAALRLRVGFVGTVRAAILVNIGRHVTTVAIARGLHISARTLRRRLHADGVTLRKLHTELRRTLAMQYLRDTTLGVEDIAAALGFHDAKGFSRAFRRWVQKSPMDYRSSFHVVRKRPAKI
jgi:AraC-like DNA-binding protein